MGACCSKGLNKYATALRHRWNNRPIGALVRRPALLVYLQVSWAVKLASWDDRRRAANHAARRTQTDERMTSISDRQSDRNAISVIVAIPHPHLHIAIENLAHTRLHRVRYTVGTTSASRSLLFITTKGRFRRFLRQAY